MTDASTRTPVENIAAPAGQILALANAGAPFLYFENTPFYGYLNGVGKIVLTIGNLITNAPAGSVLSDQAVVGHLVGNLPAIRALRVALDRILLMAEPIPDKPAN